ncbi:MAG: hypothetical protein U9P38_06090 [Campylobacterota bacterium]|nr:hypothetical protein [Campylobacterota bacterium]
MNYPDEWSQKELLENRKRLELEGVAVILVDTINSPIEKASTTLYNPFELKKYPKGTVFVFYCDSGNASLDRLQEYKTKFPEYHCLSLKGGRGYWRKNMVILDLDP